MKLLICTDIHLDLLDQSGIEEFCATINGMNPDGILITGDIANSEDVFDILSLLKKLCLAPIWFVLGNHDYYGSQIGLVRSKLVKELGYLTNGGIARLGNTGIIGHDGWYDGAYRQWKNSVVMCDYLLIKDLLESTCFPKKRLESVLLQNREAFWNICEPIWEKLQFLSKESADHVKFWGSKAAERFPNVIIATHVPPFVENAVYGTTPYNCVQSNDSWIPGFTSKAMGDALLELANKYPNTKFDVRCGHSHGFIEIQKLPNLKVTTGFSEYRFPERSIVLLEVD